MKKIILFVILISTTFFAMQAQNQHPKTTQHVAQLYALVGGGSKGIGYAIAEALAQRHYNLILVARGMDSLQKAKQQLEAQYGIEVRIISKDLSLKTSAQELANYCRDNNLPVSFLANVAGLGGDKDYLELPLEKLRYMVNLNVESVMALSLTMLPILEENAPAHILNVSSMAGFAPIPKKNLYSASKSAVIFFSQSLAYQLKDKNISVSCLCPGPVFTKPQIKKTTYENLGKFFGNLMTVPPKRVGEKSVKCSLKGRRIIVPGTTPYIFSGVIRALPIRWATFIYDKLG